MKITTYKYEKVPVKDTELFIPQEPFYCFQTGIRRAIRIIPEYTSWKKKTFNREEELWKLNVTCVYGSFECKIEKFDILIEQIENILNMKNDTSPSRYILDLLLNEDYNIRNKEEFDSDLQAAIENINK